MAVLAAMREREPRRIAEAAGRAVHHLRDHAPAPAPCARRRPAPAAARRNPPGRAPPRRRALPCSRRATTSLGADIVMGGHDQMRQHRLLARAAGAARRLQSSASSARDPVRARRWPGDRAGRGARRRRARSVRLTITPCCAPFDRGVRRVDEACQALRQPVIAARLPALAVHALLHHHPVAVVGDDEAVQIEIEAVLHRGAVDLGDQPAGPGQRRAVEARRARRWRAARAGSAANACRARRRRGCRARPRAARARA